MELTPTSPQTVGPYFHLGLTIPMSAPRLAGPAAKGERVRLTFRILDESGDSVIDAMIELWQANAEGKYHSPDDPQEKPLDEGFTGFGRMETSPAGSCTFETIKPGRVPGNHGDLQAPHINVSVFARGLLKRLATRVYFDGDPANEQDVVLNSVPESRRATLMAKPDAIRKDEWSFDIKLRGENETVFFAI